MFCTLIEMLTIMDAPKFCSNNYILVMCKARLNKYRIVLDFYPKTTLFLFIYFSVHHRIYPTLACVLIKAGIMYNILILLSTYCNISISLIHLISLFHGFL